MLDFSCMLLVKMPVVDRIHGQQSKTFATDIENKATGDSKRNDSPVVHFIQLIDQFRYIKIQPFKTIDLSTRLWGITTEFVGFIPQSLVLRSIVLG